MKLDEALRQAFELSQLAEGFLKKTGADDYDTPEKIDRSDLSADERFDLAQLTQALQKLDDFTAKVWYIFTPIKAEGTLCKNSRGRYEMGEHEYTCGYGIEYLVYDDFDERDEWKLSRVEHNGEDYYIVGDKDISLDGLRVRVR